MARRSLPPQVRAHGVTAVLGPTNTGKTHLAIERMLGHDSGMIGLPLRLLAREVYNRVVEKAGHHNVALITGEEKIKPDRPRYWISTVEAMPRDLDLAFVAVDEIQLASDLDRGHVFTDRLLNQRGCEETLLIGSATMRPLIEALIPGVHVVTRPRLSKLSFAGEKKVSRLPRRSAIVAFSAEEVYGIAELIRRQSGGAAVVLGALSPRTRNAQVELYQNGDVDYLIATDAIGMGLNLDVDHVAFASDKKFDGFQFRKLNNPELAQIAGRAGRYMRDGTFGSTGRCPPFDAETVEALENHTFDPVRILQWRSPDLDFSSLARLRDSLGQQPRERGLVRAPTGEDVAALEVLARDDDIQAFARSQYAVERLWQICQVPDYRKVSPQTHADLVGQLYRFLMKDGAVPADWFARHLSAMDRTDGDIDTLSNRIAQVRTWSFVANRPDWLKDPEHWQDVARQVEDKLSDALHERLAQRFIDRRTSVLMRRLREKTMLEAEITTTGDVTVEGQHIGHLHGFHFVPDPQADTTEAKTLRNAASKALAGEIEARADRFAETPDAMLVLSNDGTVRWMGDPVAKLEAGDKLFEPKVRILSDEHLTGPARDKVDNRLRAWLKAYVVRLLGPLLQLEDSAELTGLARGIGFQIGEALGVLERAKVLNDVRSLDQEARGALRKAGIRFGAYHLYLPALLKPAPRVLATQLWALQNGGLEQKGIDEIAHLAQSGRTSIPVDPEIGQGLYRAAGFRVLGGRAVRVDILERLADLIRPAMAYRPGITPGEPPAGAADGESFVPTVAMTSLVGCAGEDFATILKSLGYVMERRPGPAITVPLVEAPRVIEPQGAAAEGETPAPAQEAPLQEAPVQETPSQEAPAQVPETAVGTEEIGAVAAEAPEAAVSEGDVAASAAEAVASPESQALAPAEEAPEETSAAETPAEPEMIEVWRQGRRHHEGGQARHGRDARGGRHQERGGRQERGDRRPRHGETQGEQPAGERRPRQDRPQDRREAQGEGGRPQNRPPRGPGRGEERRGPRPDKRADSRREGGPERREKQPDPNSPFAKLMALKAQLEDNKK
ncbi:helicase [Microvirga sp. 3-52]|uniref:helicase-related protein n=1 Tax=Microvirga sp. 3-52 TaxID=2792425 RepID=UPI001AC1D6F7|nr:helicase-related protein [Microvirga sp. 3-52]MBO1906003.1 helicase [Microvirga sp. 3-52]MBS7452209.1 helicase [Microvirga sp. 3-52]